MDDSHKPLTAVEIEELKSLADDYARAGDWTFGEREAVGNALPRLLSLLPPPPDAVLRERCEMDDSRKPLTAGEIEDARGKLSKIPQGTWKSFQKEKYNEWHLSAPIEGSTWTFGIFPDGFPRCVDGSDLGQEYVEAIAAAMNIVPRLLSMLTPPSDAAVREAVERMREAINERELCDAEQRVQQNPLSLLARMDLEQELRIALASLRAVQAPRLTKEQVEAVKIAETLLTDTMSDYGDCEHDVGHCICKYHSGVFNLHAAFPEAFAGEE